MMYVLLLVVGWLLVDGVCWAQMMVDDREEDIQQQEILIHSIAC